MGYSTHIDPLRGRPDDAPVYVSGAHKPNAKNKQDKMSNRDKTASKEYMKRYDVIDDSAFAADAVEFFETGNDERELKFGGRGNGEAGGPSGLNALGADLPEPGPGAGRPTGGGAGGFDVNGGDLFGPNLSNISRFGEFGGGAPSSSELDIDELREQLRKVLRSL